MSGVDKTHAIADRHGRLRSFDFCSTEEPTETWPYMLWINPATTVIRVRNADDADWIVITGGAGAPLDAQYLVLALSGGLLAERRLVAGAGLDLADGGPNADATLTLDDHPHVGDPGDGGKLDHGAALTGLADDDHTQYILADGTRVATGALKGDAWGDIVKNTSGDAAAVGDVGYTNEAGEYKTTTTAYLDARWCVVLIGGANNADIYVARRGRVTIKVDGPAAVGEYLYTSNVETQATPHSYVRPEVFAVVQTAWAGPGAGTCEALLLCERTPMPTSSSNDILSILDCSDSNWASTCNGAPVGAVVAYNTPLIAGSEDAIVPAAATQLGKLILHNTTRGEVSFIQAVNVGANTITVTDPADVAAWQNLEDITVCSQTNIIAGPPYFFDVEITSTEVPALAVAIEMYLTYRDTASANKLISLHPWTAQVPSSGANFQTEVANVWVPIGAFTQNLIQRRFTIYYDASGVGTIRFITRPRKYIVASP